MQQSFFFSFKFSLLTITLITIFLFSCESKKQKAPPPPEVQVVEVLIKDTPIYKEFVGQMYGLKDIPIRARVEGFLEGIFFEEGRRVKEGQVLYTIDPQPFMADVAAKQSALAEAKTLLVNAENELARYKPLAATNAVSQSDLDAAQATRDASVSSVDAAKANLRLSEINLSYTNIKSPIDGMIGKTEAREGEFVGKSPNPVILNTVSRIDTMRVQFFLTESEYLILSKGWIAEDKLELSEAENGNKTAEEARAYNLELILSDGSTYDHKGQVDFINRNIDPTTGSMLVQAHFPNPDRLLRPGLYAKVKAEMERVDGAMMIPSRCVSELQGQYSVMVVSDSNVVMAKQISIGGQFGDMVMVSEGLNKDDRVVIEGLQKVRTGSKVKAELTSFESKINAE